MKSSISAPPETSAKVDVLLTSFPLMTNANCCYLLYITVCSIYFSILPYISIYFYIYISIYFSVHSLKSAAQPRDVLVAMETISIYYTSFDKGSPAGKDKTVVFSCRCTHRPACRQTDQLRSRSNSSGYVSTSADNKTWLLKYAARALHFCFQNGVHLSHFWKRLQLSFLQKVNLWYFS